MCVAEALGDNFQTTIPEGRILPRVNLGRHICLLRLMLNPFRRVLLQRLDILRKIGWLLIVFQLLDGCLTYLGLYLYGVEAEGNPLIKLAISNFGIVAGLSFAKLLTISVIFSILVAGYRIWWLITALRVVACFYFCFALAPWTYLILQAFQHIS